MKKFRAWDKIQNTFIDNVVVTSNGNPYIIRSSDELNSLLNNYYDSKGFRIGGDYGEVDYSDWYAIENIVIQWFTGLLDKNDVEIYEGDIVKTCRGFILNVVFEYGAFILKNKQDTYSTLLGWQSDYESNEMDWTDLNDFEVIGNINKNPELLNNE